MYAMVKVKNGNARFSQARRDLQRHLCSLAVLDHRYQRFRQNFRKMKSGSPLQTMLQASRMVQADMRLLSGLIVETGGFRYCRMGEVEHRSYLPLLLGETFEMESSLRRLTRAEERLANMLEHTRGLASREGDKSTEDAVVQLLRSSKFRIRELARTKTVKK